MRYGHDILLEKLIEDDHVLFLPKKYVVRQVLDNFSDENEATSNSQITRRSRDVDSLWRYDCWTDEAGKYISLILIEFPEQISNIPQKQEPPDGSIFALWPLLRSEDNKS